MVKARGKKTIIDGITFDSKPEGKRYLVLKEREKSGEISGLQLQVKYELIPAQFEEYEVQLKTKVAKRKRCVERAVTYHADFVYEKDGELVVEDVKASRNRKIVDPVYYLKKKMMLYFHGIKIKEVYEPNEV